MFRSSQYIGFIAKEFYVINKCVKNMDMYIRLLLLSGGMSVTLHL